jgi:hypothetical protein
MTHASRGFAEYWVRYVRYHADARVRHLQFASTTVGIGVAVSGVLTRRLSLVALASAFAFAPGPIAHALWGKDPAELRGAPHHRVVAALKAWYLALTGAMGSEVERVCAQEQGHEAETPGDEQAMPRPNMVTDHTLH